MMDINGWEFVVLALLGLFIFGPDRLPQLIGDGVRVLRQLRQMARSATEDLSRELGTDIQLEDLNPKALLRKHLLSEEDEAMLRKPMDQIWGDLRATAGSLDLTRADPLTKAVPTAATKAVPTAVESRGHDFDIDAT